jgi:hypothetical protein
MAEHKPGLKAGPDAVAAGHETGEVPARPVAVFILVIAAASVVVFLAMLATFRFFAGVEDRKNPPMPPLEAAGQGRLPPEPRLQITPRLDYLAFKAGQDSVLGSYGWVDRDSGLVRIPIERAIRILSEQGLPERSGRAVTPDLRMREPHAPVEPAPGRAAPSTLRMRTPADSVEPGGNH